MTMAIGKSAMGRRAWAMANRAVWLGVIVAFSASCRLGKTTEPDLTGPSVFGVTVTMAATPDTLPRDGRTASKIVATVRDGANSPVRNLGLHLEVRIDGRPGALGTLSESDVTTGSEGTATVFYTPPLPAPLVDTEDATIVIIATPVGTNSSNQTGSSTTIRLTELGGPTATFKVEPDPPAVGETMVLDASASAPTIGQSITTWAWDFGDGNAAFVISSGPVTAHEYERSGTFRVRLRVIDTSGRSTTVIRTIVVG